MTKLDKTVKIVVLHVVTLTDGRTIQFQSKQDADRFIVTAKSNENFTSYHLRAYEAA